MSVGVNQDARWVIFCTSTWIILSPLRWSPHRGHTACCSVNPAWNHQTGLCLFSVSLWTRCSCCVCVSQHTNAQQGFYCTKINSSERSVSSLHAFFRRPPHNWLSWMDGIELSRYLGIHAWNGDFCGHHHRFIDHGTCKNIVIRLFTGLQGWSAAAKSLWANGTCWIMF